MDLTTGSFLVGTKECHLVKYADDTTFCFPIYADSDNLHICKEHDNLRYWSSRMNLEIDDKKFKSLIIRNTMKCSEIRLNGVEPVDSLNILGVKFNKRCDWSSHFDAVILYLRQDVFIRFVSYVRHCQRLNWLLRIMLSFARFLSIVAHFFGHDAKQQEPPREGAQTVSQLDVWRAL